MSILRRAATRMSGNAFIQRMLDVSVRECQYLMGIGSGGTASTSGEPAVFRLLRQTVAPPYCIFDVGSNAGQFLRLVLDNVGSDASSIHCFEPGREAFRSLRESFCSDTRIRLNNFGIGRVNGDAVLHYDAAGSGLASLTRRRLDHHGIHFQHSENVRIRPLDDYCAENAISRIHLLKLDIEGHELDALAGATNMLGDRSVDLVTFEFGGCNIDTRTYFQDFWYVFREAGMNISRITPSGFLTPLHSYHEVHEQFRTTNFIAMLRRLP